MRVFYLCDRENHCPGPCYEECQHTRNPEFSINYKDCVPSLEELNDPDLFECIYNFNDGIKSYWEIDKSAKQTTD